MENLLTPVSPTSVSAPAPAPSVVPASFGQLWARAQAITESRKRQCLGLALVLTDASIISTLLSQLQITFLTGHVSLVASLVKSLMLFLFLILGLAVIILQFVVGVAWICLITAPEGQAGFVAALKRGWGLVTSYVWLCLLVMFVVVGGYLLIYPGIVWVISFTFVPFIFVLEGLRGRAALVRARQLVIGDGGWVFINGFILGLLFLLIVGVPFIILNVLVPKAFAPVLMLVVTFLASYFLTPRLLGFNYAMYEDLRRRKDAAPRQLPKHGIYFVVAALAGSAFIVVMIIGTIFVAVFYAYEKSSPRRVVAPITMPVQALPSNVNPLP